MYRHSLFYQAATDANEAAHLMHLMIDNPITEQYQTTDKDTGIIELRFFTEEEITDRDQWYLFNAIPTVASYALNCDDN